MVAISGTVQDLVGESFDDFVLIAKPTRAFFSSGNVLVAQSSTAFRAISGSITGFLPETETSNQSVQFLAHYTADGIYQEIVFYPVIIPNVASIDLSDLLTIISG